MSTYGPAPFFGFVYRRSGGCCYNAVNDTISYESITKKLILVRWRKKIEKRLEAQDEDKLKQTFSDNGFFGEGFFYPKGAMDDDTNHTLIATMDGQIQASYWTSCVLGLSNRKEVAGLSKIASTIQHMAYLQFISKPRNIL